MLYLHISYYKKKGSREIVGHSVYCWGAVTFKSPEENVRRDE